jgi:hypothetical protein
VEKAIENWGAESIGIPINFSFVCLGVFREPPIANQAQAPLLFYPGFYRFPRSLSLYIDSTARRKVRDVRLYHIFTCHLQYSTSMRLLIIVLTFTLLSCNQSRRDQGKHILDFGTFTIETPENWKPVENETPFDSYVGRIAVDAIDTIYFDLGWYSYDLTEYVKMNERESTSFFLRESPNNHVLKGDSLAIDSLVKSKSNWDTIDDRKVRIVRPKSPGIGITGIYIDSLWKAGDHINKFNLYGLNLKPATERHLLESIKTLKFVYK